MKNIKGKRRYTSILLIILCIFSISVIKLHQLENTIVSETEDMREYRTYCESIIDEMNSNKYDFLWYELLNSIQDIDIMFLQSTLGFFLEKYEIIANHIPNSILFENENKINNIFSNLNIQKSETFNLESDISSNNDSETYESLENSENAKKTPIPNSNTINDIDCILKIPSINLEKPVYNRNTQDYLKNLYLVAAYDTMCFNSGGTYIIYGHNSYVKNLSFQALPEVQLNDSIIIECMNSDYEFNVVDIQKAKTDQISNYFIQEENKIVLVACTNQSTKLNPEYLVITALKKE